MHYALAECFAAAVQPALPVRDLLGGEHDRAARVATWQRPCRALTEVGTLDRATTERLLRELAQPPCALSPVEQTWQRQIQERLTAQLDQLGIEDLIARIERLSPPLQQTLLRRLSRLVGMAARP